MTMAARLDLQMRLMQIENLLQTILLCGKAQGALAGYFFRLR
jgi:hypothetical protein